MHRHSKTMIATGLALALTGCVFGSSDSGGATTPVPTSCPAADSYVYATPDGTGALTIDGVECKKAVSLDVAMTAGKGKLIRLGEGAFTASLTLEAGTSVVGVGADKTSIEAPDGQAVIFVSGEGLTSIAALAVKGAAKHGILVQKTALLLDKVAISGMKGDGLHAEGSLKVDVRSTVIADNGGRGIYAKGTGPVAIIDPVYTKDPRQLGKVGIIDPVYAPGSRITGNKQGGVAIIDPVYAPKSDEVADGFKIVSTLVRANGRYGVGLWSAGILVQKTAIVGTVAGKDGPWADGILVAKGATARTGILVQLDADALVANNARTGVLTTSDVELKLAADISGNGLGGVWGQGGKTSILVQDEAAMHANKAVGVVGAGGAKLTITGAKITGTKRVVVNNGPEMGDGVGVYDGATAKITKAKLIDNERAAIVVHAAGKNKDGEADVVVDGCEMTGGDYSCVINGAPVPMAAASRQNDAESNQSGGSKNADGYASNADLPVQTDYCSAYSKDCTATP